MFSIGRIQRTNVNFECYVPRVDNNWDPCCKLLDWNNCRFRLIQVLFCVSILTSWRKLKLAYECEFLFFSGCQKKCVSFFSTCHLSNEGFCIVCKAWSFVFFNNASSYNVNLFQTLSHKMPTSAFLRNTWKER